MNVLVSDDLSGMTCSVRAWPQANVTWTYNDEHLPLGVSEASNTSQDGRYMLTRSWLQWTGLVSDRFKLEGYYQCKAANEAGEITSRKSFLNPIGKVKRYIKSIIHRSIS